MTVQQPPVNSPSVSNVMRPLHDAAGWMKLIGTLSIIYGVITALTIIGLIIAWLPIWLGILLRGAAVEAQAAYTTGDETAAVTATSKLQTIFKVQGIIILIGLIMWALMFVLILVAAIGGSLSS
ncbi:MAG: DUF5362 domain-containing protein [Actinomycetia bacterium]|nr:DUF5362 domain-containing protein [Actinomycetes bacterium]